MVRLKAIRRGGRGGGGVGGEEASQVVAPFRWKP